MAAEVGTADEIPSNRHIARSHDDTTEGAVHCFQDEFGRNILCVIDSFALVFFQTVLVICCSLLAQYIYYNQSINKSFICSIKTSIKVYSRKFT